MANARQEKLEMAVLQAGGLALLAFVLVGQTGALLNYEWTVAAGLQESADQVTPVGVAFNIGFAVADTLVYVPLLVAGLAGLWLGHPWGRLAMAAALGITAYWPIVCLRAIYEAAGAPGFAFSRQTIYAALLLPVMAYGIWGLAFLLRQDRK